MSFNPDNTDSNMIALGSSVVGAAALAYYMTKKNPPIDPLYDFDNQSIEIDPVEHIRVASSNKEKQLMQYRFPDVKTLYDVLTKGLELSNNGPCLGKREGKAVGSYSWIKYSDVIEKIKYIGSGLLNKGIESSNSTRIAIYSSNRVEWIISEHSCYSMSMVVVSLYDSYGKDSIKYILNHSEIKAIFVDSFQRLMNIIEVVADLEFLKLIVHFEEFSEVQLITLKKYNLGKVELISFNNLMKIGNENIRPANPPKPSDVATICYTSGTTGKPKGAIISHLNIISNEAAINDRLDKPHLNFHRNIPKVVHMSYLPLDDIQELKPTDIPMVPRLLNKLYDQVNNQVKGSLAKRILLNKAVAAKDAERKIGIYRKNSIYDQLIFNKFRAMLGGNIARSATGSAPISDEVMIFCKAAFSCPIPEGYGQTEATCSITFCHPFDPTLGHCGPPVACYMVKLVDVPDMGYYSKNNQGEICANGPSRFLGYLKDEEKTKEVIDEDGWLHTGDIGMWLPNGTLKIIDRKKNLFKLSQGEYVSPEKIESVYSRSPFIAQIIVEGNSLKDFTVAIAVPEQIYLTEYCKTVNINGTFEELCKNKLVRDLILKELKKLGKKAGFMSYEQIRNIHLHPVMFSIDNELATPTMKIKRIAVREHFKNIILDLYSEVAAAKAKL